MSSFHIIDAPLKRVRYYNPDLDIDLLYVDEHKILRDGLKAELAHVRSALVVRVADIVNQNATQESALDAAVAMVEVLINSYKGYGDRPGNGHKHVMQAISLLASSSQRFDVAVDLFFDMVDRFCARNSGQGKIRPYADDAFALRMMQNYDQAFVKVFLSKHWSSIGQRSSVDWSIPLERIKSLRRDYEVADTRVFCRMRKVGKNRTSAPMFSDSVKVLRGMQRRRVTEKSKPSISSAVTRTYSFASFTPSACRKSKDTATTMSDSSASHHGDFDVPVVYEAMTTGTHAKRDISNRNERVVSVCAVFETPLRSSWYDSSTTLSTRIDEIPVQNPYCEAVNG